MPQKRALLFLAGLMAASADAQTGTHIPIAESRAYLNSIAQPRTSAVDAKGIRHESREYQGKLVPWLEDQIKTVAPDYPFEERYRHHVGQGVFRLTLDVNTGLVTKVDLLKSTGFRNLDDSAEQALRYWRWKPGKWKEIVMPVRFAMEGFSSTKTLPPGTVPISRH